jgi:hypothetical protein
MGLGAAAGLLLGVAVLGAGGCGTTQVFTDDPTARIWANGQLVGRGHAQLQRTGLPETTAIRVETEDGRNETTTVKRSVTPLTVLGAFFTYGTCLIFCWQYPETVWASLSSGSRATGPSYSTRARDPWLDPDPGWATTARAPAPSEPPPTAPETAPPSAPSESTVAPPPPSPTPAP